MRLRGRVGVLRIGRARVHVEIADSILTRAVGLMFRRILSRNAGVLLCFPRAGRHLLHMWWVRFPLDVAFLDHRGVVQEIRRAAPGGWPFAARRPVRYALEVNAGTCRRIGLRPGSRCELPVSAPARA